jgi:hypothetical protein
MREAFPWTTEERMEWQIQAITEWRVRHATWEGTIVRLGTYFMVGPDRVRRVKVMGTTRAAAPGAGQFNTEVFEIGVGMHFWVDSETRLFWTESNARRAAATLGIDN